MILVIRIYFPAREGIYLLYLQTVLIIAGPGVTIIIYASKQLVYSKCHILSLNYKSKFLET